MKEHGKIINGLQTGWRLDITWNGVIRGTASFIWPVSELLIRNPKFGDPHPRDPRCEVVAVSAVSLPNKLIRFEVEYFGLTSGKNSTPKWSFHRSLAEEAIETHPDFVTKIGGTPDVPLNDAQYDKQSKEFIGFPADAPYNLGGVRGYLTGNNTMRKHYFTIDPEQGGSGMGKVFTIPSDVPGVEPGQQALKTNWANQRIGLHYYEVTEEYLVAGINGWNHLIYGAALT